MSQQVLPLVLLRDAVVFPSMVIPLFVGRKKINEGSRRGHARRKVSGVGHSA